jgi:uncharacterized protein YecE (DUF72 family)
MAMRAYARVFPVVEVQSTFYDPPADATMRKWRAATGPGLEYTLKAWQLVTHPATSPTYRRMKQAIDATDAGFFRDSPAVREGWRRSVECANVLEATAILFQCPASFTPEPDNVKRMRRFFERIDRPSGVRLMWEPRGRAWIGRRELALALCRELSLVHVVDPFVTPPPRRDAVYWRLHGPGSARASYDDTALQSLHRMLRDAAPVGPAYVMFNNLPRVPDARRFAAWTGAADRLAIE